MFQNFSFPLVGRDREGERRWLFWGVGWDEGIITAERQAQDCCASKKERKEKPKITKHQQKVISQTVDQSISCFPKGLQVMAWTRRLGSTPSISIAFNFFLSHLQVCSTRAWLSEEKVPFRVICISFSYCQAKGKGKLVSKDWNGGMET